MNACQFCETHQLLEDYVMFFGLSKTGQVLREEIGDRENKTRKPTDERDTEICPWHVTYVQQQWKLCYTAFERGEDEAFFNLWEKLCVNEPGSAFEFKLRLYFALYPLTIKKATLNHSRIKRFQAFLEERGYTYSSDPQWTAYFVLPFVPEPYNHPLFQHIYQEEWRTHLSQELSNTWELRIKDLCSSHQAKKSIARNMKLEKDISQLKEECLELIEMASDLATALEKSVQGDFRNLEQVLVGRGQIRSPSIPAAQIRALTATKRNSNPSKEDRESKWHWKALAKTCSIESIIPLESQEGN